MTTKYTRAQRARLRFAFNKALSILSPTGTSVHSHICICIEYLRIQGEISQNTSKLARSIVMQRLEGHGTLSSWLVAQGVGGIQADRWDNESRKMQETRRQWLISLREEFVR